MLFCCLSAPAQNWGFRSGVDMKYSFHKLRNTTTGEVLRSEAAFGAEYDIKQIQFHKEPVAGVLFFGLDTGISIDIAKYATEITDDYKRGRSLEEGVGSVFFLGNWGRLEGEIGVPVGPYMKYAPFAAKGKPGFKISAYYHFIPSASALILDNAYGISFNPFNAVGGVIGWNNFNVGYEYRIGFADYKMIAPKDDSANTYHFIPSAHTLSFKVCF